MHHTLTTHTLPNGVTVLMVPMPGTAAVTCTVLMGVGSRYEGDDQQGLAHFTEHMVFKGGRTYPNSQAVSQAIDAVGGEFNAFTSQEFTGFYTKVAAPHLELGLDVLSDLVLHATFPQEELEKEKGVIVEEINMYEDIPMRKVDEVLSQLAFGNTPLGRSILGTKESVRAFTREDFENYRREFYHGSQCTVALAGAVEPEQAIALVQKYFSEMPSGDPYAPPTGQFVTDPKSRLRHDIRTSEQTHLMLAVRGYELTHPKRYAYRALSIVLGGNMSSRLFTSVREAQGLCYYVRSSADIYLDAGLLVASAGVDNNRLPQAVAAIVAELQKLRDQPVSEEELERAKQFMVGKLLLSMEDSEQVAEFYGMQNLLERRIDSLDSIEAQIRAVTISDLHEIARELFIDQALRLAVVGPERDPAELESLLHFS